MRLNSKGFVAFAVSGVLLSSMVSCGKSSKKKDDAAPVAPKADDQGPAPAPAPQPQPQPAAAVESEVVGTWVKTMNEQGFKVEVTLVIAADGSGKQMIKVDDQSNLDLDMKFATNAGVTPRRIDFTVTQVNKDDNEDPAKVGEVSRCIYELNGPALKVNCSDKNENTYPAAFGGEGEIVLQKQ